MKKILAIIFILLAFSTYTKAQSNPDELADLFFKEFAKEGNLPLKSLRNIRDKFEWAQPLQRFRYNSADVPILLDMIGKYNEAQLINKIKLTDKYFIYSYAVIYGTQPLRFKLYIFNGNSQWKISQVKIDENFDEDAYSFVRSK